MVNEQVIERLRQGDWYVHCQTKRESDLLLQACNEAGLKWSGGEKASEFCSYGSYPFDIGVEQDSHSLSFDKHNLYEMYGTENITDWFFNAIKNNDDTGKLTPQNAEQEYYVQILLAIMQDIPVECDFGDGDGWVDAAILYIDLGKKYRIKPTPTPTPLPISRELWSHIDKKWQYAAMDEDGNIFFYQGKPNRNIDCWSSPSAIVDCPLNINTDGINWETSLTERPEDV